MAARISITYSEERSRVATVRTTFGRHPVSSVVAVDKKKQFCSDQSGGIGHCKKPAMTPVSRAHRRWVRKYIMIAVFVVAHSIVPTSEAAARILRNA